MGDLEYDSCPAIGSDGTLYIGAHISSTFPYHTQNLIAVKDSPTVVENYEPLLDYNLGQNFPNPFNPNTKIIWQSPVSEWQTIKVYDVLGNEVTTLVNEERPAGRYEIEFDASKLSSGVYFYQIKVGDFVSTKKMILMK
ncbi:MAG: T9SS type A sorting domain-containing protein [Ignavibacteriales bacterium]|nr:T9SS type A sorting domain-containing protein [Ignavibacteriales bacterium]